MIGSVDLPEFVHIGVLDGVQITYFDSKTEEDIARQPWMERELGSDYWDKETQRLINRHKLYMANVQIAMQRSNRSKMGVNYLQYTSGCSVTDKGIVSGVRQYAFNGQDLISFDFEQSIWVTASPLALSTRDKWNSDTANNIYKKHYTQTICVEWLQKYLKYGHSMLSRKDQGGRVPIWLVIPAILLLLCTLGVVFYLWKNGSGVVKGCCSFDKGSSEINSSSSGSTSSQSLQKDVTTGGVDRNEKEKMLPKSDSPIMKSDCPV